MRTPSTRTLQARSIIGTEVLNRFGKKLGYVHDLTIHASSGRVIRANIYLENMDDHGDHAGQYVEVAWRALRSMPNRYAFICTAALPGEARREDEAPREMTPEPRWHHRLERWARRESTRWSLRANRPL